MHRDLELGLDLAGLGHGCLPLDTHRLATALRSFTLSAVEPAALRALARCSAVIPAGVLPAVTGALPVAPEPIWQETLF